MPIVRTAGFDRPEQRAAFIAAHLVGTGLARYVPAIEPLASMEASLVRDVVAKVVQRISPCHSLMRSAGPLASLIVEQWLPTAIGVLDRYFGPPASAGATGQG